MLKIFPVASIVTDGTGSGSFTAGQADLNISGKLHSILIQLVDGANADVTVDDGTTTLLNVTGVKSTTQFYPRVFAQDTGGTDITYDGTRKIPIRIPVKGKLNATVSNGGDSKTVKVVIYYDG